MNQNIPGLVSVIVPVYNTKLYLRRCVESLLCQSYKQLEVILVDDGSTDGTSALCDGLQAEDGRIHVVHKKNAGQGLARNDGIAIARGEYIAFVDSDDYMENNSYEVILNKMLESGADLCAFGYLQQDNDGKVLSQANVTRNIYDEEDIRSKFVLHFFGDSMEDDNLRGVSSCMSVYRSDIIRDHEISFQSEREIFSEDTLFNLDYCYYAGSVITISDVLYHYCLKEDSFTKGYQENRLELTDQFCRILRGYTKKYQLGKSVDNRIRMVLWISIIDCIKQEISGGRESKFTEIFRKLRLLANREEVQDNIRHMDIAGMGLKQRLLWHAIYHKNVLIIYVLGYIKVKKDRI